MVAKAVQHIQWLIRICPPRISRNKNLFAVNFLEEMIKWLGFKNKRSTLWKGKTEDMIPIIYNDEKMDHILIWNSDNHRPKYKCYSMCLCWVVKFLVLTQVFKKFWYKYNRYYIVFDERFEKNESKQFWGEL